VPVSSSDLPRGLIGGPPSQSSGGPAPAGWRWPLVAAALAASVYCVASAVRDKYPFGGVSRNTNDLGQQFIPMYAHFRDILTGAADGGIVFSWHSGFGAPFLGDAFAYVGSSFSWLVLLFPRDRIDLALFVVYLAAVASAAALMTVLLRALRPTGPRWLAVVAGAAYGIGAWPLEAGYMTTWLNGLVAFPALCLLAELVATRPTTRSLLATPPIVALLWTTHFYTVYMATIGAAIFLVARTLTRTGQPALARVVSLLRAGVVFGVGMVLAAPVLFPVQRLVSAATPSPATEFHPIAWRTFLSRLLPATAGVAATPAVGVGVFLLALTFAAPFNSRMPCAERVVWPLTLALVALSMQVPFTHLVWHAFDTPNGNPFRQAFVTSGFLVITAWMSGSVGVRPPAFLVGAGGVLFLLLLTGHSPARTDATAWTTVTALILTGFGWLLWSRVNHRRFAAALAVLVLAGATITESVVSAVTIDARRSEVLRAAPTWNALHERARALVKAADGWPAYRTDPGVTTTVNDPMLLGGQGSEYYSSTIQKLTSRTLIALGWGYSSYGRALIDPANPVTDAIFADRHRIVQTGAAWRPESDPDGSRAAAQLHLLTQDDVAPLVTIHDRRQTREAAVDVWSRHELLLDADLYVVPERRVVSPPTATATTLPGSGDLLITPSRPATGELILTATCPPGSDVFLHAPALVGVYLMDGAWRPALSAIATRPGVYTGLPIRQVGKVDDTGKFTLRVRMTGARARLPAAPLACLRRGALEDAVAALGHRAASDIRTGPQSISFTVPATPSGVPGSAVLSVPLLAGWTCRGAVAQRRPDETAGLITVPLSSHGGRVTCSYQSPGLGVGLTMGAVALLAWILLPWVDRAVRRRILPSESAAASGRAG